MSKCLNRLTAGFNREKRLNPETQRREPVGYEYINRRSWNLSMDVRYAANRYFRDENCPYPEESKLLNRLMPCDYVIVTWETSKWGEEQQRLLRAKGLNSETVPSWDGSPMRFCFGWVRDGHAKGVFAEHPGTLEDLGFFTNLDSVKKAAKWQKYIGRIFAPPEHQVFGTVESYEPDKSMKVVLEGNVHISINFHPKTVYNDGMLAVSERCAQLVFGIEDPQPGMAFGVTILTGTEEGMIKGHAVVVPWLKCDMAVYDRKPILRGPAGMFWASRLRTLHTGRPYLDVQTLINLCAATPNMSSIPLGLKLLERKVDEANRRVLREVQDFDALESRFLARVRDREQLTWIVERSAEMHLHPVFPALFRSWTGPELHELEDMPLGRVPIYNEAEYRYVMLSLYVIAPDGSIDLSRERLKGNVAYAPGLKGKAALWRQPNGTSRERWVLDLVDAELPWGHPNMIYVSSDIMPQICPTLGTMDLDDCPIVATGPDFVELFENMPVYPVLDSPAEEEEAEPRYALNPYRNEIRIVPPSHTWSEAWFDQCFTMELENKGVGYLANALMLSIEVENGRDSMLDDLAEQIAGEGEEARRLDLIRRYKNLEAWEVPVGLRKLGSRYNDFIDMMKVGKQMAEVTEVYEAIEEFYHFLAADACFPWLWTVGGFTGHGRIPAAIQRAHRIVIARTDLCRQLQATKASVQQVQEILMDLEWRLAIPLPAELKAAFPADAEVKQWVNELRNWWYHQFEQARENGNFEDSESFRAVYARIEDEYNQLLEACPYDLKTVWVELASRIYTQKWALAPRDEQGRLYHMHDRVAWCGHMGHAGLDAIREAGLAGIRVKCDIDPGYRHLVGPYYVHVKAESGMLLHGKEGHVIGAAQVPDGDWTLHQGMILVQPAASILRVPKV